MTTKTTVEGAGGVPLHVRSDGREDADPLLLVHGTIGSSGDWALVTPHLVDDYRVISYDRRGRGRSGDGSGYALDDEIGDLLSVLAAIGAPAHVVAHSFGARLALLAARRQHTMRTLVLYEPPLEARAFEPRFRELLAHAERTSDYEPVVHAFLQVVDVSAEQQALLRSMPPAWDALLDGARTVRREIEALVSAGFDADAVEVDVPAHVLVGADTTAPLFLAPLDELCTRLATTPRRIPGQRHLANVFGPPLLAAEIRRCLQS